VAKKHLSQSGYGLGYHFYFLLLSCLEKKLSRREGAGGAVEERRIYIFVCQKELKLDEEEKRTGNSHVHG